MVDIPLEKNVRLFLQNVNVRLVKIVVLNPRDISTNPELYY